jgi:thiamine pyrophosphate-dependent acetolactate synthase large subunit-like protein
MVSDVDNTKCLLGMPNSISKSNVTSGGLGTMGFALPAAIGAGDMPDRKWLLLLVMVDSK